MQNLKIFRSSVDARLPELGSDGAAGYDLFSVEDQVISGRNQALVSTGLSLEIPLGFYAQVKSRSGLATKGIHVGAGVIDADYRGVVKVLLMNHGSEPFSVENGAKIAQMLILPVLHPVLEEVKCLSSTARGESGFGSTGQ